MSFDTSKAKYDDNDDDDDEKENNNDDEKKKKDYDDVVFCFISHRTSLLAELFTFVSGMGGQLCSQQKWFHFAKLERNSFAFSIVWQLFERILKHSSTRLKNIV